MTKLYEWPARWLVPPCCAFCGIATAGARICDACRDDLPWLAGHCVRCAVPLAVNGDVPCADCQRRPPPWSLCIVPFHYRFPVDTALKSLKFHHRLQYAAAFAECLTPLVAAQAAGVDALLPVPLHRWRHARRGFNQAAELARPLARASGLPLLRGVRRVRATAPQSGLGSGARRRNLRGAFAIRAPVRCRFPLIVDDVITTGATCRQLALTLIDAGAREVGVIAVARAAAPAGEPGARQGAAANV